MKRNGRAFLISDATHAARVSLHKERKSMGGVSVLSGENMEHTVTKTREELTAEVERLKAQRDGALIVLNKCEATLNVSAAVLSTISHDDLVQFHKRKIMICAGAIGALIRVMGAK